MKKTNNTIALKEKILTKNNSSSQSSRIFGKQIKNTLTSRPIFQKSNSIVKINLTSVNQKGLSLHLNRQKELGFSNLATEMPISQYLKSQQTTIPSTIKSSQVNPQMRKLVVEWIIQVCHKMNLKNQTLFISVYLFDVMACSYFDLHPRNLQLLALTVMFVAAKYEEIYPPQINDYVEAACHTFSKRQIIELEQKLLQLIMFKLTFSTRYTFIAVSMEGIENEFLRLYDDQEKKITFSTHRSNNKASLGPACYDKRFTNFLMFLLELSLLTQWEDCNESDITEAALFLTAKVIKKAIQFKFVVTKRVMENAYKLIAVWKQNENGVIANIYDSDKHSFVGGLKILY